jgi:hypothetical protein
MGEPRGGFEFRPGVEQRRNERGIAEEEELTIGMPRQRQVRPGNDHGGALVTSHRIESNADLV